MATDTDTAHAPAECAGRGECDVKTGLCACMPGFTGRACERSTCSAPGEPSCSGHGRCVSMQRHAADAYAPSTARTVRVTDAPWDATMLFGCICEPPYAGFDCSYRTCATGDIPTTTGQVNEVQLIQCTGASSGELTLWWEGSAVVLGAQLSAWQVKSALEAGFAGVRGLAVEFLPAGTTTLCSETLTVAQVEFTHDFGALSDMEVVYEDANGDETLFGSSPSAAVLAEGGDNAGSFFDEAGTQYKAIDGTKEESLCAGKGLCNREEGLCECLESNLEYFGSSDGYGRAGTRGECGYPLQAVAYCPGEISCSGHGVCHDGTDDTDGLLYLSCECSAGWTGADCSLRECPKGLSWFATRRRTTRRRRVRRVLQRRRVRPGDGRVRVGPVFGAARRRARACPPGHGEPECARHGVHDDGAARRGRRDQRRGRARLVRRRPEQRAHVGRAPHDRVQVRRVLARVSDETRRVSSCASRANCSRARALLPDRPLVAQVRLPGPHVPVRRRPGDVDRRGQHERPARGAGERAAAAAWRPRARSRSASGSRRRARSA